MNHSCVLRTRPAFRQQTRMHKTVPSCRASINTKQYLWLPILCMLPLSMHFMTKPDTRSGPLQQGRPCKGELRTCPAVGWPPHIHETFPSCRPRNTTKQHLWLPISSVLHALYDRAPRHTFRATAVRLAPARRVHPPSPAQHGR